MIHKGLTTEQVEESRKKHGSNILTPPEKESLWHQFLQKFTDHQNFIDSIGFISRSFLV